MCVRAFVCVCVCVHVCVRACVRVCVQCPVEPGTCAMCLHISVFALCKENLRLTPEYMYVQERSMSAFSSRTFEGK